MLDRVVLLTVDVFAVDAEESGVDVVEEGADVDVETDVLEVGEVVDAYYASERWGAGICFGSALLALGSGIYCARMGAYRKATCLGGV